MAGVICNMLLAIVLAYIVYWEGRAFDPGYDSVTIGYVEDDSPAAAAGLQSGDQVLAVNGETVQTWEAYMVTAALNDQVDLAVRKQDGTEHTHTFQTEKFAGVRMVPGVFPKLSETPGSVRALGPDLGASNDEIYGGLLGLSAAELSGLREKNVI